jgi:hypothetical protein
MNEDTFIYNFIVYGTLESDLLRLENVRCQLTFSNLNPSVNKAKISILSTHKFDVKKCINSKTMLFKSEDEYTSIKFDSTFNSFNEISYEESELNLHISTLEKTNTLDKIKPTKFSFMFFITQTSLFKNRKYGTFHPQRGYYRGWNSLSNKWDDSDIFKYTLDDINFSVYQGFLSDEQVLEANGNNSHILIEQNIVECVIDETNADFEIIKNRVITQLKKFLFILSFIEGRKMDWYYLTIWSRSSDRLVREDQIYKTLNGKIFLGVNHIRFSTKHLLDLFPKLLSSYQTILDTEKQKFDKLLNMYLIAFNTEPIEAKIIFSITCLDLVKNYDSSPKSENDKIFINKLLKSCKSNGIDWLDLFPYLTEQVVVNNKKTLELYRIRKELVHEGNFNTDIKLILKEIKNVRSLVERFLLSLLNISWVDSGLAQGSKPD